MSTDFTLEHAKGVELSLNPFKRKKQVHRTLALLTGDLPVIIHHNPSESDTELETAGYSHVAAHTTMGFLGRRALVEVAEQIEELRTSGELNNGKDF